MVREDADAALPRHAVARAGAEPDRRRAPHARPLGRLVAFVGGCTGRRAEAARNPSGLPGLPLPRQSRRRTATTGRAARPGCPALVPGPGRSGIAATTCNQGYAPRETANIANILRADVALADSAAVRALCDEAKRAAALRVEELAERARRRIGTPLREEVWRAQIDDILECFAAWVEIADEDDGYMNAGRRLGGALNARKATRDFQSCRPLSGKPLPKSSLDGARETVLPRTLAARSARKLRLSPGEQLDALGVIKRLAGDAEQFTALPRIAADSWIEQLARPLSSNGCGRRTSRSSTRGTPHMSGAMPTPTRRCRLTGTFCIRPGWNLR